MWNTVAAGLAGGMAMNLAMLLTFRGIGFGWNGDGILLTAPMQSQKLIAVWTRIEPLPLVVANPAPIVIGILVFGIVHAFIYRAIAAAWPPGIVPRAWRFGCVVFLMVFAFWEFFTPFNQLGEPLPLIALELSFWAFIAACEAFAIVAVLERGKGSTEQDSSMAAAATRAAAPARDPGPR